MFDMQKLKDSGYTLHESPNPVMRGGKNRTDKLPFIHITNPSGKQAVVPHRPGVRCSFPAAGIQTTSDEIYQAYFGLNDGEMCYFRNGYGLKSESWFKDRSKEIGLVMRKDHVDFMKNEIKTEKDADAVIEMMYSRVAMVKREEMWLAEWIVPGIEDADVTQFYFDHQPSEEEINQAISIVEIERYIQSNGETFRCTGCGLEFHWFDTDGTIKEKERDVLRNHYPYCAKCKIEHDKFWENDRIRIIKGKKPNRPDIAIRCWKRKGEAK